MSEEGENAGGGKKFGRYFILEQLATGGMAQIFKARTAQSRIFTLKKILSDYSSNADFIKMFLEEAKISLSLKHPHIVRVLDFGQIDGSYYLAMEYVFGRDLGALLRTCAENRIFIPMDVACLIISQCARALDYAHALSDSFGKSLGIVHRDISPPNILVSYNGDAKILDFGIAKAAKASSRLTTKSGVLKGKFSYMSPEQARGEFLDRQSDIFSLGIVFYELLTSRSLFYSDDDIATLENVRRADVAPPSVIRKEIPSELDKIVLKALAGKKKNRYATGAEFSDAIRKFLKQKYSRSDARAVSKFVRSCFREDFARRKKTAVVEGWKDIQTSGGADDDILLDRSFSESDSLQTRSYGDQDELRWYHRVLYDPKTNRNVKRKLTIGLATIGILFGSYAAYRWNFHEKVLKYTKEFIAGALQEEKPAPTEAPSSPVDATPPKGSFLDWVNQGKEAEKKGNSNEALEFYNRALQINSFEQSVLVRKNFVLLRQGQFETACSWFQAHPEIELADRLIAQGACFEIQAEVQKASLAYSDFLIKFPKDERANDVQSALNHLKKRWKL